MPQLSEYVFQFQSQAVAKDTFVVARFHGEEGLSQLYSFDILLVSDKADLDLEAILQSPAVFTIKGKEAELPYHGILASFEQLHQADSWVFYRAQLRPKLWWLTLTHHNQVFLDKKLDQFLTDVLADGGLSSGLDFEFRLKGQYPVWDYLCQYSESHFDFFSRWLEREGAYYWFEQGAQGEKMLASDTAIAHTPMPGNEVFHYAPPTGLDAAQADEVVKNFSLRRTPMPKSLMLKDYNYEKPSLDLTGRAMVADKGRGEIYLYGEHFRDIAEGNRLAQVRAEEWKCREQVFHGLSNVPAVRPGYLFTLDRHYRSDFNQTYLTTSMRHEGSQERYLLAGLGVRGLAEQDNLFYRNHFEAIPSVTQFRPARITEKPRISGAISAKIDAAGSGQYAELDSQGRYKVVLPFDLSGRSGGKASAFVRMMQPYAGADMGMHAPLHKGTEVLLSFMDGDPDRPVIAGAVPNPETPGPVNDGNQTMVRLKSGGGNVLHMEDQEGSQRILLHTPTAGSFIRVGYKNDPGDDHTTTEENKKEVDDPQGDCMHDNTHGIKVKSEKTLTFESGDSCTIVHGDEFIRVEGDERYIILGQTEEFVAGLETTMVGDNAFEGVLGSSEDVVVGMKWDLALAEFMELEVGLKFETGIGAKMTFHEMREDFVAKRDTFEGFKEHCEGVVNKLIADHNKLVGSANEMRGAVSKLSGEVETLAGDSRVMAAMMTRTVAEDNKIGLSILKAVTESTRAVAENTEAIGEDLRTSANSTELAALKEIL
ncbi:MAG: type VI secretion system tip protein VgrG [Desulfovibrio sp.]|jgi:type VI secretion system secreted protein VgrG|nr:type VI secretion system tip protein VgrG [Desulfovibrio sp.]